MALIEPFCFAIIALWLALRLRHTDDALTARSLLLRLACLAVASWIGEESCIRLYGFYGYAGAGGVTLDLARAPWRAFVGDVPLAVVCIWPVVIQSALDLVRAGGSGRPPRSALARAGAVAALVVLDASLIEPIAVAVGLWSWSEPGPFHVPIIGVLGWGCFAFGASLVIERRPALALLAGPVATHALLLAGWWLALRWLPRGVDPTPFIVAAWLASVACTAWLARAPIAIARRAVAARAPAAAFFFALLVVFVRDAALWAYALAFAPPWLVLQLRAPPTPKV